MKRSAYFFLVLVTLFCFMSAPTRAQNKNTLTTLTPALLDISSSDLDLSGYPLTFENGEPRKLSVKVSFLPFIQSKSGVKGNSLEFHPEEPSTLANFLTPSTTVFEVEPYSKATINIVPNRFSKALKGDYYEALVFNASPVESGEESKNANTSISSSLAVLIFFRSDPKAMAKYELAENISDLNTVMTDPPDSVELSLKNSGNTYGIPRGEIKIKDIFGAIVARGVINTDSIRIVPSSNKKIEVKINPVKPSLPVYLGVFDILIRDERQENSKIIFTKKIFFVDKIFLSGVVAGLVLFTSFIFTIKLKYGKK